MKACALLTRINYLGVTIRKTSTLTTLFFSFVVWHILHNLIYLTQSDLSDAIWFIWRNLVTTMSSKKDKSVKAYVSLTSLHVSCNETNFRPPSNFARKTYMQISKISPRSRSSFQVKKLHMRSKNDAKTFCLFPPCQYSSKFCKILGSGVNITMSLRISDHYYCHVNNYFWLDCWSAIVNWQLALWVSWST